MTDNICKTNEVGFFLINTSSVPTQGNFLTVVMARNMLWDFQVTGDVGAAQAAHEEMVHAATLFMQTVELSEKHGMDLADAAHIVQAVKPQLMN